MSVTRTKEEHDIAIVPRGILNLPTVQAGNDLNANYERRMAIKKYLQDAIADGDNIQIPAVGEGNVKAPVDNTPVMRRALIVSVEWC